MQYDGKYRAAEIWHREQKNHWTIMMYNDIDASWIERMRDRRRAEGKIVPTYTAYTIRAVALAISELREESPEINSFIRSVLGFKSVHVFETLSCGFSKVVTKDGESLVLPGYIPAPDEIGLEKIDAILRNAAEQPGVATYENVQMYFKLPYLLQRFLSWVSEQSPKLREKSRGTFNFTALGGFGIDHYTVPQSTSLEFGMGAVKDRVIARDGGAVVAKGFTLIAGFDRRVMSGRPAALVMKRASEILQSIRCDEFSAGDRFGLGRHLVAHAEGSRPKLNAF